MSTTFHQKSANFCEVAHLDSFLNVGVANVKIAAGGTHAVNSLGLFCEVDVSFVAEDGLRLVERLGKATGHSEGVRASSGGHVGVLAFKSFSIDGHRTSLGVVAAGDTSTELFVSVLSGTAIHTALNNKLFVTVGHGDELAILSLHDFAADNIRGEVLLVVCASVGGDEAADLALGGLIVGLGLLLGLYLGHDSSLKLLIFATNSGNFVGGVLSSSVVEAGGAHDFGLGFSVDAVSSAVENLVSVNGVLQVTVTLGNVLPHDGSKYSKVSR